MKALIKMALIGLVSWIFSALEVHAKGRIPVMHDPPYGLILLTVVIVVSILVALAYLGFRIRKADEKGQEKDHKEN